MWFLVVVAILAFFPLALAFGRDSRPNDTRQRRWL
jgi:hypothetical protein